MNIQDIILIASLSIIIFYHVNNFIRYILYGFIGFTNDDAFQMGLEVGEYKGIKETLEGNQI